MHIRFRFSVQIYAKCTHATMPGYIIFETLDTHPGIYTHYPLGASRTIASSCIASIAVYTHGTLSLHSAKRQVVLYILFNQSTNTFLLIEYCTLPMPDRHIQCSHTYIRFYVTSILLNHASSPLSQCDFPNMVNCKYAARPACPSTTTPATRCAVYLLEPHVRTP